MYPVLQTRLIFVFVIDKCGPQNGKNVAINVTLLTFTFHLLLLIGNYTCTVYPFITTTRLKLPPPHCNLLTCAALPSISDSFPHLEVFSLGYANSFTCTSSCSRDSHSYCCSLFDDGFELYVFEISTVEIWRYQQMKNGGYFFFPNSGFSGLDLFFLL